jgi:predicted outer membrane repeat protein
MNVRASASFLVELYTPDESSIGSQGPTDAERALQFDALREAFDAEDMSNESADSLDSLETLLDGAESGTETRQEIIFVDAATPDYQQLLTGLNTDSPDTDYQIFILQSDRDGIEQITEILGGFDTVDAIHLVSHGNEQGIQLGNGWLDQSSLDGYAEVIGSWSTVLDEEADILIYGCNLAAGISGQHLIGSLAELTGADVSASDDLTGAVTLGGDWDLEHQIGQIETTLAFNSILQQNWNAVLGTFVVDSAADTIDSNPGDNLAMDASGNTTLRAAIMEANALGGSHNIVLGAGNYTLTLGSAGEDAAAQGDLDILSDITISGADAATTIIDASGIVGGDRVFEIGSGASLNMTEVTVEDGSVSGGGNSGRGGGFYVDTGATLSLKNVVVQNNRADDGGGIMNHGLLDLTNVSIANNGDAGSGDGGGLNNRLTATLDNVTFSGNQADRGGAIANEGADLTLNNVTLSGNTAATDGGAIYNFERLGTPGTLSITNSTLTGNTSAGVNGISQDLTSSLDIKNTILNDGGSNISGGIVNSLGNNIDSDGSAGLGGPGDQVGNPMLDVLADNGGFTQTHALLSGSIAINTGDGGGAPVADQRGQIRIGSVDVGAYEFTDYGLIWGDVATDSISIATLDGNHVTDLITGLDDPASVAIDPGAGKVYWANDGDGKIQRANLDGTGVEDVITGLSGPIAIDLYIAGRKIYWTDASGNLSRANLDGSLQEIISGNPVASTGVAVDGPGGMVYWVDDGSNSIGETSLTGTGTGDLVTSSVNNTADLELDLVNGKIYWTNLSTGQLLRANLSDGSSFESAGVGGTPYGLALDPVGNKTYWTDSAAGELYRVDLSNGANRITLYSGLADPRDVDFFSLAPLTKSITAPTATNLNSTSVYTEGDASVPITDIVVTDVDFGEIITATLTLADTSTGILSANDGASYNGATGIWSIKGTVADVNTALANLVFEPATNNDLDSFISVSIDDGDEDASGPLTGIIDLDVTPVNDAPSVSLPGVFISELHYDNAGVDSGEAIEIMGPAGTDLTGWSLVLYSSGNGNIAYHTEALSGTIADQANGFGTLAFNFPVNGIQNGVSDGIALIDASSNVLQFISYEGTLTAVDGPAAGLTSTDIGVAEDGLTLVGDSLQLTGTGSELTWAAASANSFGAINTGISASAVDSGVEDTDNVYTHAQMLNLLGASDVDAGQWHISDEWRHRRAGHNLYLYSNARVQWPAHIRLPGVR